MQREITGILLGLLLPACGVRTAHVTTARPKPAAAPVEHMASPRAESEPAPVIAASPAAFSHAVGDFIVRRFSSRTRPAPTILTERVIAMKEHSIVVEIRRESGAETRTVRAELGSDASNRGDVLRAIALRDGKEFSMGKAAYDAIMRDTVFAADENDGAIESAKVKLDVQGRALDCIETRFRVKVDGLTGTMRTLELENSPWGEVGGDVTTTDGAVLYRADVVDVGREELRTAAVQSN